MNEYLPPQSNPEKDAIPLDGLKHAFHTVEAANDAGFTVPAAFGNTLLKPNESGKSNLDIAIDQHGVDKLASVRRADSNIYSIYAKPPEEEPKKSLGQRLMGRIAMRR